MEPRRLEMLFPPPDESRLPEPRLRHRRSSKPKLGEILLRRQLISEAQFEEALRLQQTSGKRLGQILIEMGAVAEKDMINALAEQEGLPHVWLRRGLVDPQAARLLPREKARLHQILPLFKVRNTLTLAAADPHQFYVFDEVRKLTGCEIQLVLCRSSEILEAIEEYYSGKVEIKDFIPHLDENEIQLVQRDVEKKLQDLEEQAAKSPIVNLVNMIVLKAIKDRASDIHIEPDREHFRVRYRIDGILYQVMVPPLELHPAVVSRLKIMANLDIAERRMPQDGRIQVFVEGRTVDLRFSSLPGVYGEKVVLRILDKRGVVLDLNRLSFKEDTLARLKALLRRPHGLILVTGPTGSGKTTTLYSALHLLNSVEKNIVTIEDPVEYHMDMVNQNQVNEPIGLTFARVLRHSLRQDPDIIMVGEIRDRETAEIAVQASLTGHLVLSTLHTNDSAGAVTRLIDMGVESYLVASSLVGVLAQRLVRTVCTGCLTAYFPSAGLLSSLGMEEQPGLQFARGTGCPACYDSGYRGRMGIYELLHVDRDLQQILLGPHTTEEIRRHHRGQGGTSLLQEGLDAVRAGLTTPEEVARAVHVE